MTDAQLVDFFMRIKAGHCPMCVHRAPDCFADETAQCRPGTVCWIKRDAEESAEPAPGRRYIDKEALLERARQLDSYAWSDFASIVAEQPEIKI